MNWSKSLSRVIMTGKLKNYKNSNPIFLTTLFCASHSNYEDNGAEKWHIKRHRILAHWEISKTSNAPFSLSRCLPYAKG